MIGGIFFNRHSRIYTTRRLWDVAPGYEAAPHPDFSRLVTLEFRLCHAGKPRPIPGTVNRYQTPAESISCDRCRGPGKAHANKPVAGSSPIRRN
jgi:hypothetical protein